MGRIALSRIALGALGVAVLLYGGWLMVRWQTTSQLVEVVEWAAAGVIAHDAVIAPVCVGVGWLGRRLLPRSAAGPVTIGLVLIGTLTATAFAVLARSHGGGQNMTLLDRNYPVGLLAAAGVVIAGVAAGSLLALGVSSRRRRSADGTGHGR